MEATSWELPFSNTIIIIQRYSKENANHVTNPDANLSLNPLCKKKAA